MLLLISLLLGFVAVFLCAYFGHVNWYWWVLIFIGGFIANCLIFFLSAGIVALFVGRKKVVIKPKKIFTEYIVWACRFVMQIFRVKTYYEGSELLEGLEGYEYISNHQGLLDPIISIDTIDRKNISFIMKKEIMNVPIVGRFLYSAGFYPLDRNSLRDGLNTINQGTQAINTGRAIGLFIEGTRSRGPELGKFHEGALKMAMNAKKDIVVSVVDNSYNVHKRWPFKKTKVLLKICKVYKYEDYMHLNTRELGENIRLTMEEALINSRKKYNNYA